jgi:general secretion pathway protein G
VRYSRALNQIHQQQAGAAAMISGSRASPPAQMPGPAPEARESGFTLLEILVVITIIGLLIGLVAPAVLRQLGSARVSVAKQSIERLATVLDLYNLDMGSYPTTEQGLAALAKRPSGVANWNGPYIKGDTVPLDPWSHAYVYRMPSERQGHDYDLCSNGPNAEAAQRDMICNP